jgi:ribose transport system substrate-binding protein
MKVHRAVRSPVLAVLAATTLVVAAGCGSSSDSSTGTSGSAATASSTASGGSGAADTAAAKEVLAPYLGKPSAFPVDEPLPKPIPAGTKIGFLQCVTPICGVFAQALAPAAQAVGAQLDVVKAGASAGDLQSAMSSLIEKQPNGLIIPGIEPATIAAPLKQAHEAGIKLVSNGIMGAERFGMEGQTLGRPAAELAGRLLAAWTVDRKGEDADIVFYNTPELSFSAVIKEGFAAGIKELCPGCSVRYVDVPIATIGNSAPAHVVSDLQSHPKTNTLVFATSEASTGLPAALKTAGLTPETIGFAPGPANLQDIKDGKMTAGLAVDVATIIWTLVDETARLLTDSPLTAGEKSTVPVMQIVTAKDLDYDVSKGWTGYPDYAERFAKLWKAG